MTLTDSVRYEPCRTAWTVGGLDFGTCFCILPSAPHRPRSSSKRGGTVAADQPQIDEVSEWAECEPTGTSRQFFCWVLCCVATAVSRRRQGIVSSSMVRTEVIVK